ncbi:hypothetical protein TL16_g05758 [Triparma laevis f. inornata]|uniref:PH domain-containing protein n=1 Tax=Triparma laevis f. inornata TaxID=1714386 RepID=A0A9W7AJ76_9STRA|nr:hypothetical protein TL16_g05758 [Triparma laevis f. inornata]
MKPKIPDPPKFGTLDIKIPKDPSGISGKDDLLFLPNSRTPIPLITDTFEGQALLVLKPQKPEDDKFYHERIFKGKQRKFEIQIQGKFKKIPKGTVYIGGEITEGPMNLGLVTRGLCNMLLGFARKINSAMNYSFGDKEQEELPHIVFPLWTSVDKMVVTKEGESVPEIGVLFPEDEKERNKRRGGSGLGDWNTHDTYSFSFNSMYVDLPAWKLVSLPMMRDMDLKTFWGTAGLRLVVYENEGSRKMKHKKEENKYVLCIETKFKEEEEEEEEEEDSLPWGRVMKKKISRVESFSELAMLDNDDENERGTNDTIEGDSDDDDDESDEGFFDAVEKMQSMSLSGESRTRKNTTSSEDASADFVERTTRVPSSLDPRKNSIVDIKASLLPIDEKTDYVGVKSCINGNNLCPGFIDMCDMKVKSRYTRVYAFAVDGMTKTVFRTPAEFNRYFPNEVTAVGSKPPKSSSPRLSTAEIQRRIMGSAYKLAVNGNTRTSSDLQSFSLLSSNFDKYFLRGPRRSTVVATSGANGAGVLLEGAVARALSETHFIEEWAVLTSKHLAFYHPDNRSPSFRIPTSEIIRAKKMEVKDCPSFPTYSGLEVETLGRIYYLMLKNEGLMKRWIEFINDLVSRFSKAGGTLTQGNPDVSRDSSTTSASGSGDQQLNGGVGDDPSDGFLHKSSVFKCKKRRLLNCRKFCFRGSLADDLNTGSEESGMCPNLVVAEALRCALEPHDHEGNNENLKAFLNHASELKRCHIGGLSEKAKLTFFLNLYHLMITHAYLVLGTPTSSFKWISYFNMISYQVDDDIFSLTELEHCIIRAGMNFPAQFLSKYVLPTSRYSFALNISDPRINFALNCGSLSNPPSVPIYYLDRLDQQLNLSSIYYLQESVTVSPQKKGVVITLPHICMWYANDFNRGRPVDVARYCSSFLTGEKQKLLVLSLDGAGSKFGESGSVSIRFENYNWTCRTLTLLDEELLAMLLSM